jgi:hypothetical protein
MTVFIAHAPADCAAAEALEKVVERRGFFCELDDGQTAKHPVQASDVLVLLLSKDFMPAPARLRLEQRALDAWAEERLVVVRLDGSGAPVGLRDLPAIDARNEARRALKWQEAASAIGERLQARPGAGPPAPAAALTERRSATGLLGAVGMFVLALLGVLAVSATAAIWLANRLGPRPGGWPELRAGVDAFGARFGLSGLATEAVFAAAIAAAFAVAALLAAQIALRRLAKAQPASEAPAPAGEGAPAQVFVSYASANAAAVMPVIEAAKQAGRDFWLDQQGAAAGAGWAGEIVRAIRGAADVVVMCSKAAFESDQVKREIYLADRYRKRLVPVFIEEAALPEDFEYFFSGVQSLRLFETPEAERPQALMQVLGAS